MEDQLNELSNILKAAIQIQNSSKVLIESFVKDIPDETGDFLRKSFDEAISGDLDTEKFNSEIKKLLENES